MSYSAWTTTSTAYQAYTAATVRCGHAFTAPELKETTMDTESPDYPSQVADLITQWRNEVKPGAPFTPELPEQADINLRLRVAAKHPNGGPLHDTTLLINAHTWEAKSDPGDKSFDCRCWTLTPEQIATVEAIVATGTRTGTHPLYDGGTMTIKIRDQR